MLTEEPELGYRIGAVVGKRPYDPLWKGLPTRVDSRDLIDIAEEVGASGVLVVASGINDEERSDAIDRAVAEGLHVEVWPGLSGLSSRRVRLAPVSGIPVLYVEPQNPRVWQSALKRGTDLVLATCAIPFVLPVLLAAAICIKLEDRGPVIYRHSVVGRYGAPITVLKLRTMVPNASALMAQVAVLNERRGGPLFKATNDPRVTRVGRILRATSIDELPQLWNVFAGTMSLVGPRFALPAEVAQFDEAFLRRQAMRPGITGLWQTEARDNPSFSAYRRLDLFYLDNWSLRLDLAILANTLYGVITRAFQSVVSTDRQEPTQPDSTLDLADSRIISRDLAHSERV
jgi:lipopolysaccharide/colanic/teichoic acid biosynthesis glycosyltransferase